MVISERRLFANGQRRLQVPRATLKKWTSGKGNAQKDFMLLRIYKRWGVEFESIDEAEAFAAAKWGLEQFSKTGSSELRKKTQEV